MDKKDNKNQYIIRNLRHDEIGLWEDFLSEAIYVPERVKPPAKEIIELPERKLYIEEFGIRPGDNCLVADFGGKAIGAVWARKMCIRDRFKEAARAPISSLEEMGIW